MNRNFNIVLVVVILGSLFAVGVNSFLHKLENTEQPPVGAGIQPVTNSGNNSDLRRAGTNLRQVGTDIRRAETSSLPGGSAYSISGRRAGVNMRGVGVSSLPSGSAYNISIGRVGSIGGVGSAGRVAASGIHLQSVATMHSVGGSGSMVDSRGSGYANFQLAGTGKGSNYAGSNYNSIGLAGIYSSTSSLIAGNRTYNDNSANSSYGGSTRAAARRNINYPTSAGNTPQLYDMSAPVGGFNSLIGMNGLSALYSLNGADEGSGNALRRVAGMYSAWVEKYKEYYGTDADPTTEQLNAFITWWQGEGMTTPTPDTGGGGSSGPSSMYQNWLDQFYDYYGRYPSDEEELSEFIKWWQGGGITTPSDPDPTPPGGGPSSIYQAWLDLFNDYYGRNPNDMEELIEFIQWWQGGGIYTPFDAPIGDLPWLLIALLLIMELKKIKRLKRLKELK